MERIINLDINFRSLIKFAQNAIDDDPLVALQNLNEAERYADSTEEKAELYQNYIRVYRKTANNRALLDVVGKETECSESGEEFFRLDFGERKEVRTEFEDEAVSYEELKRIAKIRALIEERRYDEAFDLLENTDLPGDYAQPVVDALSKALDADEKFTLDRRVVPLLKIMACYPDQAAMISLMLSGGPTTHSVMVDSADYFLEDEGDSNALCLYGMAYFKGAEPAIAERFFVAALETDPMDEDALFYLAVIEKMKGNDEKVAIYWNRYREVYRSGYIPEKILSDYFSSQTDDALMPYILFPLKMMEKYSKILFLERPKGEVSDEFCDLLFEASMLAPVPLIMTVLDAVDLPRGRENLTECYKKMLAASRVPQGIKDRVLENLIYDGYEGRLTYVDDKRVIVTTMVNPHMRQNGVWPTTFRRLLCELFYMEQYVPIHCSTLVSVVRKVGTSFAKVRMTEDEDFALSVALINYLHKIKSNADYMHAIKEIGVELALVEETLYKYGIDKFIVV